MAVWYRVFGTSEVQPEPTVLLEHLHAEFKRLLPYQLRPIAIQRWSWRRILLTVAVLFTGIIGLVLAINLLTSTLGL